MEATVRSLLADAGTVPSEVDHLRRIETALDEAEGAAATDPARAPSERGASGPAGDPATGVDGDPATGSDGERATGPDGGAGDRTGGEEDPVAEAAGEREH